MALGVRIIEIRHEPKNIRPWVAIDRNTEQETLRFSIPNIGDEGLPCDAMMPNRSIARRNGG
jgi:hypothetical protein